MERSLHPQITGSRGHTRLLDVTTPILFKSASLQVFQRGVCNTSSGFPYKFASAEHNAVLLITAPSPVPPRID
eukprot:1140332-Pelagomonas_calceolata.AAC.13